MKKLRKYILYFLLGLMVTSAGLNWKIPFINSVKAQEKSVAIDKSEELNSLTFQRTRSFTKIYEIANIKSDFYKLSVLNFEHNILNVVQYKSVITFRCAIDSYLHLLQLY